MRESANFLLFLPWMQKLIVLIFESLVAKTGMPIGPITTYPISLSETQRAQFCAGNSTLDPWNELWEFQAGGNSSPLSQFQV